MPLSLAKLSKDDYVTISQVCSKWASERYPELAGTNIRFDVHYFNEFRNWVIEFSTPTSNGHQFIRELTITDELAIQAPAEELIKKGLEAFVQDLLEEKHRKVDQSLIDLLSGLL